MDFEELLRNCDRLLQQMRASLRDLKEASELMSSAGEAPEASPQAHHSPPFRADYRGE